MSSFDINSLITNVYTLMLLIALLGGIGLWLIAHGTRQCLKRRLLRGSSQGSCGSLLFILSALSFAVLMNVASYSRLTHEQAVAEISFKQLSSQHFTATMTFIEDSLTRDFLLKGDEWQLEAKVLKWHGIANLMGLNAQYKLHRITGRYSSIEESNQHTGNSYQLTADPGLNLWSWTRRHQTLLPFVDAYYGSAVFLPMSDNAEYKIFMTQSGLIARPLNSAAKNGLLNW